MLLTARATRWKARILGSAFAMCAYLLYCSKAIILESTGCSSCSPSAGAHLRTLRACLPVYKA